MREFILNCSVWEIAAVGLAFFGGIYVLFGAANVFITHYLLPALHIGQPLDPRPLAKGTPGASRG